MHLSFCLAKVSIRLSYTSISIQYLVFKLFSQKLKQDFKLSLSYIFNLAESNKNQIYFHIVCIIQISYQEN